MKHLKTTIVMALMVLIPAGAFAESDETLENPHLWKPSVKSVAVFKNGLGFFTREGDVKLRDGWCVSQEVPPAAFGTLAIYSTNEKHLVDIVGSGKGEIVEFDGNDAPRNIPYKRRRLEASKGLKVELAYKHKGTDKKAAGKIVSISDEFVVLETEQNSFAVPLEGIQKMQILELPVRIHVDSDSKKEPEQTQLGMAYLRKGITWIPEYSVKLLDDTTAELTLRGTLVNEAEDLIHSDVHFVVGVPHFLHTDYMAPIAVGQAIRTIGAATMPVQVSRQITNRAAIVSNGNNDFRANQFDVFEQNISNTGGNLNQALGNLPKMQGPAATDYTVYTKTDMNIRRGEKAIVTLFVKKIKYSHIYRWSTPQSMKHFLVLHNSTDSAWTTGPYLAISNERPLSEDLLKYTPKGGNCEIPVTQAINVSHEKTEKEVERKLKAHSPRSNQYLDLVTLSGEVKLRNFEKETIHVVVTIAVPGKPLSASDDGLTRTDSSKLKLTERAGSIRWKVTLKPNESKTMNYQYERYVTSG
ncbi:MAG: hypothetical protein ACYTET_08355 [Planctomycetota bacterium]|jgi:hypothetical protein